MERAAMITTKKPQDIVIAIEDSAKQILKSKNEIILGFTGGRSIKGLFPALRYLKIPWDKTHIFMVDERLVPIDSPESNFRQLKEELLNYIKVPVHNIHPLIGDVESYEKEFKEKGGCFDIAIMGVGEDGHVAALFPHFTINNEAELFFKITNSPKPPPKRMSSSRKLLLKTKLGIFLFVGEAKKQAYENFKNKKLTIEDCPVKIAYELPESVLFIDLD
jgi:6-phosphogluconolactonase